MSFRCSGVLVPCASGAGVCGKYATTRINTKIAQTPTTAMVVIQKFERGGCTESLMVREAFFNSRIANRDEFSRWEVLQVGVDTESADADHRGNRPHECHRKERLRVAVL